MLLAFDTSSASCTAALFDADGSCLARVDEVIGRGHAERLVPMIGKLLDGRRVNRILVGVGPGSFTGIRVAVAAAHGLAIGWNAELRGMSSLALLAAGVIPSGQVAAAVAGGHGELFVQQFDAATLAPVAPLANCSARDAAELVTAEVVVGSGAKQLVDERGWGEARERWPSAARAFSLPLALRALSASPFYARAPDARLPKAA